VNATCLPEKNSSSSLFFFFFFSSLICGFAPSDRFRDIQSWSLATKLPAPARIFFKSSPTFSLSTWFMALAPASRGPLRFFFDERGGSCARSSGIAPRVFPLLNLNTTCSSSRRERLPSTVQSGCSAPPEFSRIVCLPCLLFLRVLIEFDIVSLPRPHLSESRPKPRFTRLRRLFAVQLRSGFAALMDLRRPVERYLPR